MARKIAVLIRDRQAEAFRMSLGLTLADDKLDVFVLDRDIEWNDRIREFIELMKELEINLFTNQRETREMDYLSTTEIARKLADYDHLIAY